MHNKDKWYTYKRWYIIVIQGYTQNLAILFLPTNSSFWGFSFGGAFSFGFDGWLFGGSMIVGVSLSSYNKVTNVMK